MFTFAWTADKNKFHVAIRFKLKKGDGNGGDFDGRFSHSNYCFSLRLFLLGRLKKHRKLFSNLSWKMVAATAETMLTIWYKQNVCPYTSFGHAWSHVSSPRRESSSPEFTISEKLYLAAKENFLKNVLFITP